MVEVVTDRLRMWWRLSRTDYGCGGGSQAVDVVEVVTDCGCGGGCQAVDVVRLSRTGCGCGGCRHGQVVDVVEVVTDRMWM